MKWIPFIALFFLTCSKPPVETSMDSVAMPEAQWISFSTDSIVPANTWLRFQKTLSLESVPPRVPVAIAADTKYWLWVNGEMVVREGGLKWGPTPNGYYVDTLDLSAYLRSNASNKIDLAVWYFGKNGFSHRDHGIAGLYFSAPSIGVVSDTSWQGGIDDRFAQETEPLHPNYRLPESNIHFDGRRGTFAEFNGRMWAAVTMSPDTLRGEVRPIPQWRDFGMRQYSNMPQLPMTSVGDTLVMELPYNAQITPYFRIRADRPGRKIDIRTDNYFGGGPPNVRTEYLTATGEQEFETPGWMNGHRVRYHFPAGIEILDLGYRETGYATEFTGDFSCDDPFYEQLWKKSRRTLYITLRDSYMDCPDRERAQWWGDVVLEMGETFYALDRRSDLLSRKAIRELMRWQRPDSTIYSPVPAGNWNGELPTQMLASVGYYGIWHYFQHTGDTALIREVYPMVKQYLALWQTGADGLVVPRKGGWTWGDWGDHKDMPIIFNGWYYLAQKGLHQMATLTGDYATAIESKARMDRLAQSFHRTFWTGTAYRSPRHQGPTDDRSQALAVLTGIAPPDTYPALREVLRTERHASPYFEKYILEALFDMGYPDDALLRMKERYRKMVESPITTLWEGWAVGDATWGGGTYNHAWSGGPLTLLSAKVVGIEPLEPGYGRVRIQPRLGTLERASATVDTPLGLLQVRVTRDSNGVVRVEYEAPGGMDIIIE